MLPSRTLPLLSGLLLAPTLAFAADYEFTRLAGPDDLPELRTQTAGPFFSGPGIDRDGRIVVVSARNGPREVWRADGASVLSIASPGAGGLPAGTMSSPVVNDVGQVAFQIILPTPPGAFNANGVVFVRGTNGGFTTAYSSDIDSQGKARAATLALDGSGGVTFSQAARVDSIGATPNDPPRIASGDALLVFEDPGVSNYSGPVVNTNGSAAFVARINGSPFQYAVYRGSAAGGVVKIGDSRDQDFSFINSGVALDNLGRVYIPATVGVQQSANRVLFMGDDAGLTTLVDSATTPFQWIWSVGVNQNGKMMFAASLDSQPFAASALFDGTDATNDRVIGAGDQLDGKTVSDIGLGARGVNAAGQVAFLARFADGSAGYYRADPVDPDRPATSGFIAPSRVRFTPSTPNTTTRLVVSGTLDSGSIPLPVSGAANLRAGPFAMVLTSVAKKGDLTWTGEAGTLTVRPGNGGSRTTFSFDISDAGLDAIDANGGVDLSLTIGAMTATGRVPLASGQFKSKKAPLLFPRVVPTKGKAKQKKPGKDSVKLVFAVGALGAPPTDAPDLGFTLSAGETDVLTGATSPDGWKASKTKWTYRGAFGGGKAKLQINYKKGTVTISAKKLDLAGLPEPGQPLVLNLSLGVLERSVEILMGGKSGKLKY